MAMVRNVMAAVLAAAAVSQLVVADADAELKAKLGAAVIPLLRKGIKIEDNWVVGEKIMYVCAKGKFDYVRDTGLGIRTGHGMGTLADAQNACSTDGIKTLLANKAGGSVKNEQECKNLVDKTLSDPVLCGRKEGELPLRFKDLEGVRALFVGAARYQALADAVKLKAQTKLGIAGKDTCPEGMKFCYQCSSLPYVFTAVGCVATSSDCSSTKPKADPTKMFTVDDIEEICKTPTMHETQKECAAFLVHDLADRGICRTARINKLSEMNALIKPPTLMDADDKPREDDTDYHSGKGNGAPLPPKKYPKIGEKKERPLIVFPDRNQ